MPYDHFIRALEGKYEGWLVPPFAISYLHYIAGGLLIQSIILIAVNTVGFRFVADATLASDDDTPNLEESNFNGLLILIWHQLFPITIYYTLVKYWTMRPKDVVGEDPLFHLLLFIVSIISVVVTLEIVYKFIVPSARIWND
jgi:hypothetical protein